MLDYDYRGIATIVNTLSVEDSDTFEDIVATIEKYAHELPANNELQVLRFGENKDLTLSIEKDEDFNPEIDEEASDLVSIVTLKDGEPIDDVVGIYVTDGELYRELERIYGEKDMELL